MKDSFKLLRLAVVLSLFCCIFQSSVHGKDFTKQDKKLLEKKVKENPQDYESLTNLYYCYSGVYNNSNFHEKNSAKALKIIEAMMLINKPKTLYIKSDIDGLQELASSSINAEKMDAYYYLGKLMLKQIRFPKTLANIKGRFLIRGYEVGKLSFPNSLYDGMNYLNISHHEDEFQEYVDIGLAAAKEMDTQILTGGYKNLSTIDDKFKYIDALEIYMPLAVLGVEEAKDRMDFYINDFLSKISKYDNDQIWLGIMAKGFKLIGDKGNVYSKYYSAAFNSLIDSYSSLRIYDNNTQEQIFKELAIYGLVEAQYSYGKMLQNKGLHVDAFEWFLKAATKGYRFACYEVANCYDNGNGVQKDPNTALSWHRYAADLGVKKSATYLESVYKNKGIAGSFTAWYNNLPLPGSESKAYQKSSATTDFDNSIDVNIPISQIKNSNTFVVCISNENYNVVQNVPYALNDARVFSEYCRKTLGVPIQNIRKYEDASLGIMISALSDIKMISESYDGDINIIIYYSGHGINNEKDSQAYLLPIDADGKNTDICFSLQKFYADLGQLNAKSVTVFIDACFSGAIRGDGMLIAARGIAIKPKENVPMGNMIVLSASQGDETALPFEEKRHGMFTYFILKKLNETNGNVSLGELADYVSTQVRQQSIVINRKPQTPKVLVSSSLNSCWRDIKLK